MNQQLLLKADPATSLLPLYKPVKRGQLHNKSIKFKSKFGHRNITVTSPFYLNAQEQTVLLIVLFIVNQRGIVLEADDPLAIKLRLRDSIKFETVKCNMNVREIAKHMYGRNDKKSHNLINQSIQRTGSVVLHDEYNAFFLTYKKGEAGNYEIAINYRFAIAMFGEHAQFISINLSERHNLKSDTAKILHYWLSSWLREGNSKPIKRDTLITKVWDNDNEGLIRNRRVSINKALDQINSLKNWKIVEDKNNKKQVIIARGVKNETH